MDCLCWPSPRQGFPAEDTQRFPVHSTRHTCVSRVVFDPWVLQAIKIPGKVALLEFLPQFPFMTSRYYLAIIWHLQIAHTWKRKHPKYHPAITTASLWYSGLYYHQYRFICLSHIIRAQALFITRIPSFWPGTKNTCEKLSFPPSLRAFKWAWRKGASDKCGAVEKWQRRIDCLS